MGRFFVAHSGGTTITQAVYRDWLAVVVCRACGREQRWDSPELVPRFPNPLGATFDQVAERIACTECPDGGWGEICILQGHTLGALEHIDEARIARLNRLAEAAGRDSSPGEG